MYYNKILKKSYIRVLALIIIFLLLIFILTNTNLVKNQGYNELNRNSNLVASYMDGEYQNEIPNKDDEYIVERIVCDNGAVGTWDNEEWGINIRNATQKIKCSLYFRLKNDVTVTYDNNYVVNNIFSDIHDENYCGVNGSGLTIKHEANNYNGSKLHTYTAPVYDAPGGNGFYMTAISNGLTIGTMYYYSFEAKITSSMSLYIGSEKVDLNLLS